MRNVLLILFSFFPVLLFAQRPDLQNKVERKYFKSGKLSTEIRWDSIGREASVKAYDHTGKIIFDKFMRNFGGSERIEFQEYHANGGIHKIYHSSQPDGGIQWYNATYFYSEDGKLLDLQERSYEDQLTIRIPKKFQPEQEVAACAIIVNNLLMIENPLADPVSVVLQPKFQASGKTKQTFLIHPGQKIKTIEQISAQIPQNPMEGWEILVIKIADPPTKVTLVSNGQVLSSGQCQHWFKISEK